MAYTVYSSFQTYFQDHPMGAYNQEARNEYIANNGSDPKDGGHAVIIVGYGKKNGKWH